jgi:hypothetical protein|tara:strand:+ start:188 stop:367 length:180 start_codon:yes stop_codon:yes gene_type:complete
MLAKCIPPEIWWALSGVNYIFALLGAYLGDNQLLVFGFLTAACCIFSGYISKRERENGE